MSGCVAPHILNLGCFCPQGKSPQSLELEVGWEKTAGLDSLYMLAKMLPK